MPSLLVKNSALLVTMDPGRQQIPGGGIFARDGVIEIVGHDDVLPNRADTIIDATGMLLLPGLVNVHHHFSQNLTRALPIAQDEGLFPWLDAHYPIWAKIGPEEIYVSTQVALAELLLSGCTTTADHAYLFPNGSRLDDEIKAAEEIGVRFCACRGSTSLGISQGGLIPDYLVESEQSILEDSERLIQTYHDPRPGAMCRIALGPADPESVSRDLLRETLRLGRRHAVQLHMHVSESMDDVRFSLEKFDVRPVVDLAEQEWVGPDVVFIHAVHVNDEEINILAKTGTKVAHCPSANMRLGSGIAPIRSMLDRGVVVGLAVDGSASNDSSHMLAEVRMSMLLQRVAFGPKAMTSMQALELATLGGADVLGRDDIGSLEPGKAADFIGIHLDRLEYTGALADPLAATVFCAPVNVNLSVINGKLIVQDGHLISIDLPDLVKRHNQLSQNILSHAT